MKPRRRKTATKRRQRTRSLERLDIVEYAMPISYLRFVEALEYRDELLGVQKSYLRKRTAVAEAAKLIRRWTRYWLKAKATGCRGATDIW